MLQTGTKERPKQVDPVSTRRSRTRQQPKEAALVRTWTASDLGAMLSSEGMAGPGTDCDFDSLHQALMGAPIKTLKSVAATVSAEASTWAKARAADRPAIVRFILSGVVGGSEYLRKGRDPVSPAGACATSSLSIVKPPCCCCV